MSERIVDTFKLVFSSKDVGATCDGELNLPELDPIRNPLRGVR